ncbi:NUDIX hydrolase domain-like protein [Lentinula detonsa]|uniref:NUDIX hydrolase domain-like protein n=1 Tax=Lentinula detonsa TaxID=2804962 RepID=A0A9W8P2Q5_9AGAR|nr:NUDIX hydrolase domain-like protein [Lentinula detonsa]KAJ3982798.1 NUDIX hydrolase domain-like protein [Lentinula detonsa]
MADSPYPTRNYFPGQFVVSAGSILFRRAPESGKLQICVLYHTIKDEWLLPKGRKDCGESIETTAVRETYEETGYKCKLLPCNMSTRAPAHGVHTKDMIREAEQITEPIAITVRDQGLDGVKIISWYISELDGDGQKVEGTQMDTESFASQFINAEEAIRTLTFKGDQDIAAKALEIVRHTGTI